MPITQDLTMSAITQACKYNRLSIHDAEAFRKQVMSIRLLPEPQTAGDQTFKEIHSAVIIGWLNLLDGRAMRKQVFDIRKLPEC